MDEKSLKIILKKRDVDNVWTCRRSDSADVHAVRFDYPFLFRPIARDTPGLNGEYVFTDMSIKSNVFHSEYVFTFDYGQLISIVDITGEDKAELDYLELPFDSVIVQFMMVMLDFKSV